MLRTLILAALLLALGAGAAPAREAGGTPVAFVAVERASQLVAVDLTTKRVVDRIAVPTGPREVTTTGDLRYVLVTSPPAGKLTLVDSFTGRVLKIFGGFGRPLDVAVEGEYAYVTDARGNQLVVIDLMQRRIASRIRVPSRPHSVAAGDVALVTHSIPENFVTIVHLGHPSGRGRASLGRVRVPAVGLGDISEQGDSGYAYVTLTRSAGVAALDWGNRVALWVHGAGAIVRTSPSTTSTAGGSGRAIHGGAGSSRSRAAPDARSAPCAAARARGRSRSAARRGSSPRAGTRMRSRSGTRERGGARSSPSTIVRAASRSPSSREHGRQGADRAV